MLLANRRGLIANRNLMVEKTLDLFPTEPDPSLENNSKLAQWVEPNSMASKLASSFEFSRFSPAAATNAERLYPHAPLLKAVATTKENVQPKSVHRRLWLTLNFPLFPRPPDVSRSIEPTVVTETAGNVQKVLAKNRAAQQLDIERGMSLNSAYALSNHLQVRKRDPASEQQALERLATWASQYTSSVSIEKPDALLLEVKGSLRLFGGARALRQKMFAQLHEMEVVATAALAPTSRAALWLARSAGPYPNVPNLTILP